ncbi:hypothetical protein ABPG74_017265 [Tetrahymena malaccensis]
MLNRKKDSPYNSFFQFKNSKLEREYTRQDYVEKKKYLIFLSVIQLINSIAYIIEEQDYSYFPIAYFSVIILTNLMIRYFPKSMPYAIFVDQVCSCYFASRQVNHISNSYSSYQDSIFIIGQTIGQYLLLGGSNILLDAMSIASSQIIMVVLLSEKKIYANIILISLIFTFSFYKFLHNQNERNYFYQKNQNQQWMQVIDKTIQNEILIANLESGHLQLHDLNKKAKSFKIHESNDDFTLFLENMVVDKKKSSISIDIDKIQNSLKSYMLVRLSILQEQEEGQKSKQKVNQQLITAQQTKNASQQKQLNDIQVVVNKNNNENQKQDNEIANIQPKCEILENKRTISTIKSLIRKKSDSRKLNATSIVSKQNPSSTRPSKTSESKVISQNDNFGVNNQNLGLQSKQENKEQNSPDIIYCDYKVDDKVVKKYKISISVVQTDQYLLVLSFEENTHDSQRELKKQNETLNKILIRSHLGYMQKQQNQLQNLNEMNYGDLKLNQYMHMNSVFSITQYLYLQKRNKMPIKVQEFNFNNLIDSVKSIFPQLQVTKEYNVNESSKLIIRNDYNRITYILISILSSIFHSSKSSINDTPQRNRITSNFSNANQFKILGTPKGQVNSPPQSGKRQIEQLNSQKTQNKLNTNNKEDDLPQQQQEKGNIVKNTQYKNLNKFFMEMEQEETNKVNNKIQEGIKTKFGTPKLLHANYESNEELINNYSLTKERNRRAVLDGYSRVESNLNSCHNNNSDLGSNQIQPTNNLQFNNAKANTQETYYINNLQQYCKRDNQNQSKISEKQILQKNTDEIDSQTNYEEIQHEQSERFELDEARNTHNNTRQIGEDLDQSSFLSAPQMTVKLVEKQKDYQKDYFQVIIVFQPSTQQNTPVTQNCQDKKAKQNMRGYSSVLNSMIGNPSELQQQSKTQYSNTNNSVLDQDYCRRINENDQTLNEMYLNAPSTQRNTENNENLNHFQNLNGNQDDLINSIEEKILLECVKQVCNSGLDYKIDKSGNHIVNFCVLSDLPLNTINQLFQDKKRAISIHSLNSNSNNFYYQGNQSINSMVFGQKEKLKSINSNVSTNVNSLQQFQSSIQSLYHFPASAINSGATQNSNQQNIYKVLNQKSQQNQIKNGLKQNNNGQINSILNSNQNPQYSPQINCRKRQASLPIVSEKLLGYFDIKEDESLENNHNNSNEYIKNKVKQENNCRKNSTSMTSLEKSPNKQHIFNHKIVKFEKLQQVVASSTLLSENKFGSPKTMQQSMLSGSCIHKNKYMKNKEKTATYFKDFIDMSKQIDASLNEQPYSSLQIESERKQENFVNPKAFDYSMKRNSQQYD